MWVQSLKATFAALTLLSALTTVSAQTSTSCNPLEETCAADAALGKSVTIDLTSSSDQFTSEGSPAVSYDSNGAAFTVAASGDSPLLASKWYIMFGKVSFTLKAAPGQGIVSSAVLQSDDLDEIDWEFIGSQDTSAQSNYFGKGITGTYNRGGNHVLTDGTTTSGYHVYTVDWSEEQIVWQIDGTTVRVLTSSEAATNQYPQSPMMIKVGAWAGGDPSNAAGTIAWAGGAVNYAGGPYTMYVKEIQATDYSTGTSYSYDGTAGTWESIQAAGGTVNGNAGAAASSVASSSAPAVTSTNSDPEPFGTSSGWKAGSSSATNPSVWPWVASTTLSSSATGATTSISGLPSGWTVSSSGKAVPPSAASQSYPSPSSSPSAPPLPTSSLTGSLETVTTYNQQGFPTVVVVDPNAPKSYDQQGFLITTTPTTGSVPRSAAPDTPTTLSQAAATASSATEQADSSTASSTSLIYPVTGTSTSGNAAAPTDGPRNMLVNVAQALVIGGVGAVFL